MSEEKMWSLIPDLGEEWYELLTTGKSKHCRLVKSKEKQAKGLMQDKSVLETMRFFDFIGLQPTQFEDCWRVEFSLRDYQQYFHIEDRDKAYIDLQNHLDDATSVYKSVYKNEKGTSWAAFYLVSGYDYANGIIQASITKKGKELIDKLRGMEDEWEKQWKARRRKGRKFKNGAWKWLIKNYLMKELKLLILN